MLPPEDELLPRMPIDLRALQRRAQQYSRRCERWLADCGDSADAGHSIMAVRTLSQIVPAEIERALAGWLATPGETRELAADPEGAAAIALAAIEISRDAWFALLRKQRIRALAAEPFITDLVWLRHEVERVFPDACRAL